MRYLAERIFVFICLALLTALAFLYIADRRTGSLEDIVLPETSPEDTSPEDTSPYVSLPDDSQEHTKPALSAAQHLADFSVSADDDGYAVTDAVYDESCRVFLVDTKKADFIPKNAKYTVEGVEFFTLWPRMGYIILADGTQKKILTPSAQIIPFPEKHDLSFFPARNKDNLPLFRDWGNNGAYVTLSYDGTVTESSYDEKVDSRGSVFDYPSYYGISDSDEHTVSHAGTGFGFTVDFKSRNARNVAAQYNKTYAYSEGYGCAIDGTYIHFFDVEGIMRIGRTWPISERIYTFDSANPPKNTLGYFYFDEGLTRVTRKPNGSDVYEALIDREGKEFPIPSDFSLLSYSNGMILLEKDGKFGYMNSRGKWIGAPEFDFAEPFYEGLAVVGNSDGKKGVIDKNGNYVIKPVFDEITNCSGGVICAFSEDIGWSVFNKKTPVPKEESEEIPASSEAKE